MSQLTALEKYRTSNEYSDIKMDSKEINGYYNLTNNKDIYALSKDQLIYILEKTEKEKVDITSELENQKNEYLTVSYRNSTLTTTNSELNNKLIFFKTAFIITLLLFVITFISVGCIFAYKKIVAKVRKDTIKELTSQNKESL